MSEGWGTKIDRADEALHSVIARAEEMDDTLALDNVIDKLETLKDEAFTARARVNDRVIGDEEE